MDSYNYRIHPAIGIARVGNSEDYYIGPETVAGLPKWDQPGAGGLPIKPDKEETITSSDLRDDTPDHKFKRQAARFKIYQYPNVTKESYPNGGGKEIKIGSTVNGKTVTDIIWTVHVANKKPNTFVLVEAANKAQGISGYEDGKLPPVRNANGSQPSDPIKFLNNANRVKQLTIDPGPRTISVKNKSAVKFNQKTGASYYDSATGKVTPIRDYPKSFPGDSFPDLHCPEPEGPIDTLGELQTDSSGRLLVLGGYGKACSWLKPPYKLESDVNNDGWFDDTSDGPVTAVLVFGDDDKQEVQGGGWVATADPNYAPQILNTVPLWDDIYDAWVRQLALRPEIYDNGSFVSGYKPYFEDDVNPFLQAAALQQWVANLPSTPHDEVAMATATKPYQGLLSNIRNPNDKEYQQGKMPLSLGDANTPWINPRPTQYFFLKQWEARKINSTPSQKLGGGEQLDRAVLRNCLGGRFSPGIDLTFVVRQPDLYIKNWQTSGAGPFRVKPRPLNYNGAQSNKPLLTEGYIPLHTGNSGLEPGDLTKLMAIPWHTDYNSCTLHLPNPNPQGNNTLFWSWPAQRPTSVFKAADVTGEPGNQKLGPFQRFTVRGPGTAAKSYASFGNYQVPESIHMILTYWHKIGVTMQGTAIDPQGKYPAKFYLEVESRLEDLGGSAVPSYPVTTETKPEPQT